MAEATASVRGAAGAAAALAADDHVDVADVDTEALRRELAARGAVVI